MKRYRLDFQYRSPFGDHAWTNACNESTDLAMLQEQLEGQATMPDVRNSRLSEQEVSLWKPLKENV